MSGRLIIVSNRLPFKIERKNNRYELRQSSGGLVSALKSIPRDKSIIWIGAADFKEEVWQEFGKTAVNADYTVLPVFIDKKTEKHYYNGFSNSLIWPLFHYFPSFAEYEQESFKAYTHVNKLFTDLIKSIAEENDLIWIQDYHLMLVPGMLKEASPSLDSSFFLHIPFPSYEIVKLIPEEWRNKILKSLLQASVLGFQTKEYVSHFRKSVRHFLGEEFLQHVSDTHTQLIRDYPISIDFDRFHAAYDSPEVTIQREKIRKSLGGKKLVFSLDRLDYSKGVLNRLVAYEQLLQSTPSIRNNIVLLINVIPSRAEISKYAERKCLIEEHISRINGIYGSIEWQPVIYQYQHLSFNELLACYTACDVALVTPLRDGMNLVAKEFVASRKDKRAALVLSEFAGASAELKGAIIVNPNDVGAMQQAILKGIRLKPQDQELAMNEMQKQIRNHSIHVWLSSFINDFSQVKMESEKAHSVVLSFEDKMQMLEAYKSATKRLILLDYDGTLTKFHDRPENAKPNDTVLDLLKKIADNELNELILVSGRDAPTLQKWFGHLRIGLAAEHGIAYKAKDYSLWENPESLSFTWKEQVMPILQKYAEQVPLSFIEEKAYAIAWHFRNADETKVDAIKLKLSRELQLLNEENKFEVLLGNKILEIKSNHANKGSFALSLIEHAQYDFILAIGDDVTDEDMFRVLREPNQYTIKVGLNDSNAKFNLINVNSVLSFLDQLSTCRNKLLVSR